MIRPDLFLLTLLIMTKSSMILEIRSQFLLQSKPLRVSSRFLLANEFSYILKMLRSKWRLIVKRYDENGMQPRTNPGKL